MPRPDVNGTLVRLIDERAGRHSDQVAYTYLEQGERPADVLTFGELGRRARSVAAFLQARIVARSSVLLVLPNRLDFVTALMGCLSAGLVAVPVAPPRNTQGLVRLLRIAHSAGARGAISATSMRAILDRLRAEIGAERELEWLYVDEIPDGLEHDWREPPVDAAAAALLQFTSGSTGNPKGVIVTHQNVLHNCELLASVCGTSPDLTFVTWLPFFHDWGLIGCLIFPWYLGRPCFVFEPADFLSRPRRWLEAISRFRGTVSCAPNFAYDLCARQPDAMQASPLDLSCWEMAMVGAEPVRKETIERFSAVFGACGFKREAFYPCYGLAESTLIVSGGARSAPPVHAGFDRGALEKGRAIPIRAGEAREVRELVGCGRPLRDQQVIIVDPETRSPSEPMAIGEIWVSGLSVAQGYFGDPELTRQVFAATMISGPEPKYLRTGDLGFLWQGELYICGRLRDIIIKAGANYFAEDIEHSAARSHPGLRANCGAAFGVDLGGSERLVIVQELDYGKRPNVHELIGSIQKAISRDHDTLADAIAILKPGSLDKTSSGKIRRQHTKSLFLSNQLRLEALWQSW